MNLFKLLKDQINTQQKGYSAIITLISCLIIITPLCGFLFKCGCDWPWLGLDSKCNIFQPKTVHQCPWCTSLLTGVLSTGLAIITGVWASIVAIKKLANRDPVEEVLIRVLFGLSVFLLVAIIMAILASLWQAYPWPNYFN